MSEFITRETAKCAVEAALELTPSEFDAVAAEIDRAPGAYDVAPVRHGRWNPDGSCSRCGEYDNKDPFGSKFCPNCGAKMDGGGVDAGQPKFCSNPNCTEVTVGDDCTKNDVSGHREIHDHGQRTDQ